MDFNRNENGDAAKAGTLYPSNGRVGKKFSGSSKQSQRRSYHQMKMLGVWKRIFKRKHKRDASEEEIWAAAHQRGGFGEDIERWINAAGITIEHGLDEQSIKGLEAMQSWLDGQREAMQAAAIEEAERDAKRAKEDAIVEKWKNRARIRAKYDKIPKLCIERVHQGLAPPTGMMNIFGMTREEVDALVDAYYGD